MCFFPPPKGDREVGRLGWWNTVDGRNPAPGDMVNIPLFAGFHTSRVVVWDFFHQQYCFIWPNSLGICLSWWDSTIWDVKI